MYDLKACTKVLEYFLCICARHVGKCSAPVITPSKNSKWIIRWIRCNPRIGCTKLCIFKNIYLSQKATNCNIPLEIPGWFFEHKTVPKYFICVAYYTRKPSILGMTAGEPTATQSHTVMKSARLLKFIYRIKGDMEYALQHSTAQKITFATVKEALLPSKVGKNANSCLPYRRSLFR